MPPTVGLLVPPASGDLPPEAMDLYPDLRFVAEGLGVARMTADDFDRSLARVPEAVDRLVARGADVISMMGTSISFYLGIEENRRLVDRISRMAGGRPASSMASAVLAALDAVPSTPPGSPGRRVVVGAAYDDDMTARLVDFLSDAGHEVLGTANLGVRAISDLDGVGTDALIHLGDALLGAHPDAQALLISCGGLRTAAAGDRLTATWGVPVVSSAVDGVHDAVALLRQRESDAQDQASKSIVTSSPTGNV